MEKLVTRKRGVRFFAGLVKTLFVLAAPLSLHALEAKLSLDNDRFVVGQKVSVDILVNAPDPLQVKLNQPSYPPLLTLVDGPFIRETSWQDAPGKMIKGTKITLNFRVLQSGLATLGPFGLSAAGQSVVVPSRTLYLLAVDEAKKRFPLEVRWVAPPGTFYQGQDIPLLLQVRNLDSLIQPQDLEIPAPANSLWEKAIGVGEIEIFSAGEDRIMNIPWGAWMLIPTSPGTVDIASATVLVGDLQRKVPPLSINVLPLPAEVASTRAVGDLTYAVSAQEGKGAQEGQVIVTQTVRGRGNFPYLVFPDVQIPGLKLLSRQEGADYRPTSTGYQGSLTVTWRFSVEKPGQIDVPLPGFVSFQSELAKVWTWDAKTVRVNVSTTGGTSVKPPTSFEPLPWDRVREVRPMNFTKNLWAWLFVLPGPLFWFATFFLKKTRGRGLLVLLPLTFLLVMANEEPPANFDKAMSFWKSGDALKAQVLWDRLIEQHPDEPGLWYNKALASAKSGQSVLAVQAFRKAHLLGFQGTENLAALRNLEEHEQLVDQFEPWTGPSEDLLFILLCASLNLLFVFWGFHRLSGKAYWVILMTLALLLGLGDATAQVAAMNADSQVDAVIGPTDGPIHKVPGDLAEAWMTLKKGTVVHYLGTTGEFVLVQTGYGLEGWVRKNFLMSVKDE